MKTFVILLASIVALSSCAPRADYETIDEDVKGLILSVKKDHRDKHIALGDTVIIENTILSWSYHSRRKVFSLYKGQALPESTKTMHVSENDTFSTFTFYLLARKIDE